MNHIEVTGEFASEVAFTTSADATVEASFLVRDVDPSEDGESFVRVKCSGEPATILRREAEDAPFRGRQVTIEGSLKQYMWEEAGEQTKSFYVAATTITLPKS